MRPRILLIALLISLPAVAADEQQSTQPADPQTAQPSEQQSSQQGDQQPAAPGPYVEFNKQVQEKLRAEGFYSGPISGEFGFNTQAALAQFQLSRALPASGSLDATTLTAMGLEQFAEAPAEAGAASATVEQPAGGTIEAGVQSGRGASAPAR